MDSLRSWTHCFLTHAPLDGLSGFEHAAEADTCQCCACRSSHRAACLEAPILESPSKSHGGSTPLEDPDHRR